jgi:hypothetical protein
VAAPLGHFVKRLIAVCWAMPPMLFPRAIQVARLLRQLVARGWECSVVCLKPSADIEGGINDGALASHYAGTYRRVPVDMSAPREDRLALGRWRELGRRKPDDPVAADWVNRASHATRRLLREDRAAALITFAQPWTDHLVGLRLRPRLGRTPWIAHFSDPWVDSPYFRQVSESEQTLARRWEAQVVHKADALMFVTQRTADLVMAKYPTRLLEKVHVLPHGFDEELLRAAIDPRPRREPGPLRIVSTGQLLSGMRTPDTLLQALGSLKREGALDDATLELTFVGLAPPDTVLLAESLGLAPFVHFIPRVTYLQSLQEAARADVLLLIDAPSQNSVFLPSKLVDYLMIEKPILGITPTEGAVADILNEIGYPVVEPTDFAAARQTVLSLIAQWRKGSLTVSPMHRAVAQRYDVRRIAADFEMIVTSVAQPYRRAATLWRLLMEGRRQALPRDASTLRRK